MYLFTPFLVSLSLLLMAAHSLRVGDPGLVAVLLGGILLAWSRRAWGRWVLTAVLAACAVGWVQTGTRLVALRLAMGAPWERLALILAAVLLVTLAAMVCLQLPAMRRRMGQDVETAGTRAAAMLLTTLLLAVTRWKVAFPILLLDRFAPGWGWLQIAGMAWYAGWLAVLFLDPVRHRTARPMLWAGFSALFFGQLLLGLAGWRQFLMTGTLHLPVPALILGGPLFRGEGIFMLVLFLATVALVGPAWCSHLCYIGAWDDQASRRAARQGRTVGRWLWLGRGLTLALTVAAALGLRAAGASGMTALWAAILFGLVGVGIMLAVSTRLGFMAHCTTFCPMGLVGNLLGRCTPWRMRMTDGCTRCGRCSRSCRYGALSPLDIARGRPGLSCTLCGDCVASCRHSALEYRFASLGGPQARRVFVVLIVSLHATFAAVARL